MIMADFCKNSKMSLSRITKIAQWKNWGLEIKYTFELFRRHVKLK